MSRLSRLRSFWRSLRRGTVRDGSYRPHAAVNLLPTEYRDTGGLREDGTWVLSASTGTKEHGTRTPATVILGDTNFCSRLGAAYRDASDPTSLAAASKRIERIWSGGGTA